MGYALITGAASGMGRIYARRLSERGYGVVLVDIDAGGLDSLADELGDADVIRIEQDLTERDAASRIAGIVREHGLQIEILINNAGMIFTSEISETPSDKLFAMMMLHCTTPLLLCHELVPEMKASGRGRVLNVSSICAWMHWPAIGMYANTKGFVKDCSRSLRLETRGTGVTVTAAFFGAVDTPLFGFSARTRRKMHAWGLMISPEKAVDKALKAMFKGKKRVVPGLLNRLAIPVVSIISDRTISRLYRKYRHLLTSQ